MCDRLTELEMAVNTWLLSQRKIWVGRILTQLIFNTTKLIVLNSLLQEVSRDSTMTNVRTWNHLIRVEQQDLDLAEKENLPPSLMWPPTLQCSTLMTHSKVCKSGKGALEPNTRYQPQSLIGAVLTLAYFMEILTRVLMEEANQESKFRLRRQAAYEEQELPEG